MQHLILRCKHCQKTYTYCTYGNGPEYGTEEGCSQEYCAECQKAIDDALKLIPVKFEGRFKEIKPTLGLPAMLDDIKRKNEEKEKQPLRFPMVCCVNGKDEGYDYIDEYTHDNCTYRVEWDEDHEDEKHYFIKMEYDIAEGDYTGERWRCDTNKDTYRQTHGATWFHRSLMRVFEKSQRVESKPMPEPIGDLMFLNYMPMKDWDIKLPHSEPEKPGHVLMTYTFDYGGKYVKTILTKGELAIDGQYKPMKIKFDVSPDDINEELKYSITIEKYDDEDEKILTGIRVV